MRASVTDTHEHHVQAGQQQRAGLERHDPRDQDVREQLLIQRSPTFSPFRNGYPGGEGRRAIFRQDKRRGALSGPPFHLQRLFHDTTHHREQLQSRAGNGMPISGKPSLLHDIDDLLVLVLRPPLLAMEGWARRRTYALFSHAAEQSVLKSTSVVRPLT
jgi:hypothetical protein